MLYLALHILVTKSWKSPWLSTPSVQPRKSRGKTVYLVFPTSSVHCQRSSSGSQLLALSVWPYALYDWNKHWLHFMYRTLEKIRPGCQFDSTTSRVLITRNCYTVMVLRSFPMRSLGTYRGFIIIHFYQIQSDITHIYPLWHNSPLNTVQLTSSTYWRFYINISKYTQSSSTGPEMMISIAWRVTSF